MSKSEPIEPAKKRAGWHPFRWLERIDRVESESFRRVIQSIMSAIIGAAILGTIAYVWTQREWLIGSSKSASQFIWNLLLSPIQLKLWILFLIAVAVIWIMYLLRGRKKEPKSLAALKISASMQLRHTDKKRILLIVDVLNMASKTAFIKKVSGVTKNQPARVEMNQPVNSRN